MRRRGHLPILLAAVALGAAPSAAEAFALREFDLPRGSTPRVITRGPDGAMWFTAGPGAGIGRIDSRGRVRIFRAGLPADSEPYGIVAATDGNLWFTDPRAGAIGRITPAGVITESPSGLAAGGGQAPGAIAPARDGGVWYIDALGRRIGRMSAAGEVTLVDVPPAPSGPAVTAPGSLVTGPDGRLWFTNGKRVGVLSAAGELRFYDLPGLDVVDWAQALTIGPQGDVWVLTANGRVGRVDPRRGTATVFEAQLEGTSQGTIAAAPGGRLWVTAPRANQLYDVTTAGRATAHGPGLPSTASRSGLGLGGLAVGPGGGMWATEAGPGRIAQVIPGSACAVPRLIAGTETSARRLLRAGGCRPVVVRSTTAGRGPIRVTSQSARAGSVLPAGARIRLVVGHLRPACRLPEGARVRVRNSTAVVAEVGVLPGQFGDPTVTVYGCAFRTGRLVRLSHIVEGPTSGGSTEHIVLQGTRVAVAEELFLDQYGDATVVAVTADLARAARPVRIPVAQLDYSSTPYTFDALALGPTGALAWIQTTASYTGAPTPSRRQEVHLWAGTRDVTLDTSAPGELTGLRVDAATVSWEHAGSPRSSSLPG